MLVEKLLRGSGKTGLRDREYRNCGLKAVLSVFFILFGFMGARADQGDKPYFTDIGQFNYAKFLMHEQDYRVAAREFARLIENFPASPLIPETQFRLAEAYFYAGMYRDAEAEFKLFLANFGNSPFAVEAHARIGEARRRLEPRHVHPDEVLPTPEFVPEAHPGLRAVQVMLFDGRGYAEIDGEMRRLKDSGVDTVIARVFHNAGDRFYPSIKPGVKRGVYFSTKESPVVGDILGVLTQTAHKNGLRIFAWMTTRYADYGVENREDLACRGYDVSARRQFRCKGLDLFNEGAVKRLERIYTDLAAYDIDGILFQDDLVLRHNEGFGPEAAGLFKSDTGLLADPEALYLRPPDTGGAVHYTQLFWKWASWKNRRLLAVAERLKTAVRKKRPDVKFALNLMYESVTNPPFALAWLSQSLKASMETGFDYYSIMAYHRQMGEELNKRPEAVKGMIEKMVADASDLVRDPHRVLIKIQTIDWRTGRPLSNGELVSLIRDIKGIRDVSLAAVPYRKDFPFHELGTGGLALLHQPGTGSLKRE